MIEFSWFQLLGGEPEFVQVPTDSGGRHWVARCPTCRTAMWNEHGSRQAITKVRSRRHASTSRIVSAAAHIFVRSRQAWFDLPPGQPAFAAYYDANQGVARSQPGALRAGAEMHQAQRRAPRHAARGRPRRPKPAGSDRPRRDLTKHRFRQTQRSK